MCANPENMKLYNFFRECPEAAQKPITAGRLKGKTDINPMWRLKKLTEVFGPCGFGWTVRIVRTWLEDGAEKVRMNDRGEILERNRERTANVEIALKVKHNGEWSEEIAGIGGAMFLELENRGFNTEDEAYKKAYTDAISVACKALGIAADIYFAKDPDSKYQTEDQTPPQTPPQIQPLPFPEAEKARPQTPPIPNPASFAKPTMTREEAAKVMVQGVTLTELYKTNKSAFMAVLNETKDPRTFEAAKIIYNWVREASAK